MARQILFAEVPGFYAAVERAEDPTLAERPVIVGGDPRKRGRVQAATPDALADGVELDTPMLEALRLCPRAKAARTNMVHYREVSRRLMVTLRSAFPRLEAFGLAAVYANLAAGDDAGARAAALRKAVRDELGLPLRVGVASGKFLARLAAQELPDEGFRRIPDGEEHAFLESLSATRLDGVGRKTAATLAELGAHTIGDVRRLGRDRLQDLFGAHGLRIYGYANGSDDEPVRARNPRSVSRESTVRNEAKDLSVLVEQLAGLAQNLEQELSRQGLAACKVTLKLRFADQGTTTRTQSLSDPLTAAPALLEVAQGLLSRTAAGARPVRGVGLQLSGLVAAEESDRQLALFSD